MIRCLVFDFDGTLVPSNAIKRDAYTETVAAVPGAGSRVLEIIAANPDFDRHRVFAQLATEFPAAGDGESLAARYSAICEAGILPLLRNGPTRALIAALADLGLPSHIATATPYTAIARLLDRAEMTTAFASIHGRPETKTAAVAAIIAAGNYAATEVAVIGDGPSDRHAAGVHGCAFLPLAGDAHELHAAAPPAAIAFLTGALKITAVAPVTP